ncbi:MAG: hypothetical protein LBE89_04240 [Helicobacteraceae bacterium]|nr:hypothetical protein [Helicobacteraceae bacterium]
MSDNRSLHKYFAFSIAFAAMDYAVSYASLLAGLSHYAAIASGTALGAILGYLSLEFVVFKRSSGGMSAGRIALFCLGMALIYIARVGVFGAWRLVTERSTIGDAAGMLCAYGAAFVVGYLFQSRVTFRGGV